MVFWTVTVPGVDWMSAIRPPFRQNVQRAPTGVVRTEICWEVPSKIEAQPASKAQDAKIALARKYANRQSPPERSFGHYNTITDPVSSGRRAPG